ncbi:MAG: dienelactone hydrolase family protein [Candidatus Pacebacteria bacterium]|nr:dienelactone hydrolase family protein [Candidatus Paceibacterota bacterium]
MKINNPTEHKMKVGRVQLHGLLFKAPKSDKLVIFAHGSGSSRLSPRNIAVAEYLASHNISAFLFDLLTKDEDLDEKNRFDIDLMTKRLVQVTWWLKNNKETQKLKYGYFGASTGAAAALLASLHLPEYIKAIVSRGGRPDLALKDLQYISCPTLLIVGGADVQVLKLNQQALDELNEVKELAIVENATHLFEEPGTMEEVSRLATDWFEKYLI